ncbi:MAG: hypothetical protein JO224_09170 [Pelomonas sp.]|nr:hypothetical protein [Roseateles sp.]
MAAPHEIDLGLVVLEEEVAERAVARRRLQARLDRARALLSRRTQSQIGWS